MVAILDLNLYLIENHNATFFMRANSDSMIDAGIRQNDLLLIDRSIKAKNNSVVIAIIGGEFVVRRLKITHKNIHLVAENKGSNPIKFNDNFHIWGVVTSVIHQF